MGRMRIALAQIDPTVGDITGNARLIRSAIEQARAAGAQLVVFPELAVIGYPPKDLLLKPAVIQECMHSVEELATGCGDIAAIIGYPCFTDRPRGRALFNAAALCHRGRIASRHLKSLLPTYDVFDEQRYFEPGPRVDLTVCNGLRLGISICEDLWNDPDMFQRQLYHNNPVAELAAAGAQLFINCSASPYVLGKYEFRRQLFAHAAQEHHLPLLYFNQVGGNDELVFDGHSCAFDAQGQLIAQAKGFEEDLLLVEVEDKGPAVKGQGQADKDEPAPRRPLQGKMDAHATAPGPLSPGPLPLAPNRLEPPTTGLASVYHALVLGLSDYCRKCGFKSIVLGLSGGIDSALTAALCVAALGPQNVRGVAMPSRYSSDHSVSDARDLAQRLGIKFHLVPIAPAHAALEGLLTPQFEGRSPDTTEENVQARIRGVILMAMSNKFGSLLVTTGNKSELAVGYCTLYGDMCGGLAVICDVPKTMVWALARWINTDPASPLRRRFGRAVIPESSITKAPSAELRPNQTDQDSLPPYELLDQIVERYVEREESARQILEALRNEPGVTPEMVRRVIKLIDLNEYKRKQAAPGIKVTGRAFGFGRRMPIAQRYDAGRSAP